MADPDLGVKILTNSVRRCPGTFEVRSNSSSSLSTLLAQKPASVMSDQALCSDAMATSTSTPETERLWRFRRTTSSRRSAQSVT